ncbi:MAG: hypothetical protein NVV60_00400 [Luteimonas sp.]|nr:hypothetical protein [Luteimonas sp.]
MDSMPLRVREVSPELLGFGIRVFQAVMIGDMPLPVDADEGWAHPGVGALMRELAGHGYSEKEEIALVLRVLGFAELIENAVADPRMAEHVELHAGGVRISDRFLAAAAGAPMQLSEDGFYSYDLDGIAGRLLH